MYMAPPLNVVTYWFSLLFRFLILPWRLAMALWRDANLASLVNIFSAYSAICAGIKMLMSVRLVTATLFYAVSCTRLVKASYIPNGLFKTWLP